MNCPGCAGHNSKVLESRIADAGDAMRRRRECLDCAERFTTYERVEQRALWVVKHDGSQEPFSSAKLLRGLAIACSKRGVPAAALEALAASVERELRSRGCREVSSDDIGARALGGLVRIDEAAAIRFATVIDRADTLAGFRQVLDRMAHELLDDDAAAPGEGAAAPTRHHDRLDDEHRAGARSDSAAVAVA